MTLVADLADRGINPAESPYDCLLEVDVEEHHAVIVWTETLGFHAEYNGRREYPAAHGYPAWSTEDSWSPLVDEHGWLTPDAETALQIRLAELMPTEAHGATVFIADPRDDHPNIVFEVVTDYAAEGETYEAWLDRIGWPVIATLINVTDPGTFNSPYLFDASTFREA